MDRAELEEFLAQGLSLNQIGARVARHPSTVAYWVQTHGLVANGAKHARRTNIDPDLLKALADEGLPARAISERLGVSQSTVNRLLLRQGIRRRAQSRRDAALAARERGATRFQSTCKTHGVTDFLAFPDGGSRCAKCNTDAVSRRRRNIKAILVAEAGGRCVACGFDAHPAALQFHHLDPTTKAHGVAESGATRSIARARKEAAKCILLCANCHAAVGVGAITLPVELAEVVDPE